MAQMTTIRNDADARAGHRRIVLALGIVFVGTLIHTIGTITRGWIVIPELHISTGLFNADASNGSLITVRAFTIIGIILGVVTLICAGIYLRFSGFHVRRKAATCILVAGIGAGGASLIGALIFALEFYFQFTETEKNYSFALCIVGGTLISGGSIVMFLGARQHIRARFHPRTHFIIQSQSTTNSHGQNIHYQIPDNSEANIWHTQLQPQIYREPPPSYHELQFSHSQPPKQQPEQIQYDTLPPSYSDAVKWYPNT